jgi:hypothetical protein
VTQFDIVNMVYSGLAGQNHATRSAAGSSLLTVVMADPDRSSRADPGTVGSSADGPVLNHRQPPRSTPRSAVAIPAARVMLCRVGVTFDDGESPRGAPTPRYTRAGKGHLCLGHHSVA